MKGVRQLVLLGAMTAHLHLRAQDPQFSQWFAAAQYLNPALTGNTHQDRIAMNYRLQWPGVRPGYETYMAAYDHRFSTAPAGIGGMVLRDKAGTSGLYSTTVGLSYSYEARINYRRALRFGTRIGYTMRGVDPSGYLFADQVLRDNAPVTIEPNLIERVNYLDLAGGLMYYSEHFWAGMSMNHLNRPNTSLMIGGDSRMQVRTSVNAGYRFPLDERHISKSDTRMTLAAHYKMQGKWDQLDIGWYIDHGQLTGGLWYRGLPLVKAYWANWSARTCTGISSNWKACAAPTKSSTCSVCWRIRSGRKYPLRNWRPVWG